MKKTNTVRVNGNMIFKGHKLTIGLDLGDYSSCYCVLDEAGKIILEQKVTMYTGSDEADIFEDTARSNRHGDGNTFLRYAKIPSSGFEPNALLHPEGRVRAAQLAILNVADFKAVPAG